MRSRTESGVPAIHILPPVFLLACDTVRWRRKPRVKWGASMSTPWIPILLWKFFKRLTYIFCQLSQSMSSDLQRHAFSPWFSQSRCLSPFFFFFPKTVTFWVSFQEEVSSICQTHREQWARIRMALCKTQSNRRISMAVWPPKDIQVHIIPNLTQWYFLDTGIT